MSVPSGDLVGLDVHAHFLPASVVEAADHDQPWHGIRFETTPSGGLTSTTSVSSFALPWPDFRATIDSRIASMDRRRVAAQVLSMTPTLWRHELPADDAADLARDVNDELADVTRAHPSRFGGFAFLPLQDPAASVTELERAVRDLGLVGASIPASVNGEQWDADELFPVLEAAAGLGAFLFVHPTSVGGNAAPKRYHLQNLLGLGFQTTVCIASLIFGRVLDRLPDLQIGFAHGGGHATFMAGRLDHGYRVRPEVDALTRDLPSDYLRQLYYDSLTHSGEALRYRIDQVGVDRFFLGSDYPADMGEPDPVRWLESQAMISDVERRAILADNLRRVLGGRLGLPEPPAP